jgi:hypothetical protein
MFQIGTNDIGNFGSKARILTAEFRNCDGYGGDGALSLRPSQAAALTARQALREHRRDCLKQHEQDGREHRGQHHQTSLRPGAFLHSPSHFRFVLAILPCCAPVL